MSSKHRSALVAVLVATVLGSVLGAPQGASADGRERPRRGAATFEVASFNILGSNHTVHSRHWASGKRRAAIAKRWLGAEGVSVAGVQEAQVDQMKVLTRHGDWQAFPEPRTSMNTETAQSVVWRGSQWRKLEARTFRIPFDLTQVREQPMVLLRHRGTGRRVWVVSVHLTSGGGPRAVAERRIGTRKLVRNVRRLQATGVPVVVTGDMNGHDEFFCRFAGGTDLVSPAGGSHDGSCSPPPYMRIDWLFGTRRIEWSGFRYADGGLLDRVTDHTVPVATATLR